jgi:hypothetical protein
MILKTFKKLEQFSKGIPELKWYPHPRDQSN